MTHNAHLSSSARDDSDLALRLQSLMWQLQHCESHTLYRKFSFGIWLPSLWQRQWWNPCMAIRATKCIKIVVWLYPFSVNHSFRGAELEKASEQLLLLLDTMLRNVTIASLSCAHPLGDPPHLSKWCRPEFCCKRKYLSEESDVRNAKQRRTRYCTARGLEPRMSAFSCAVLSRSNMLREDPIPRSERPTRRLKVSLF